MTARKLATTAWTTNSGRDRTATRDSTKPEPVEPDAEHVPPRVQQPDEQARVEALDGLGAARGDGLEDRADAVAERGGEGRQQTQQHPTTLAEGAQWPGRRFRHTGRHAEHPAGAWALRRGRRGRLLLRLLGRAAIWLAYLLLRDGVRTGWPLLLLVVFWLFFTYLVLPRLHRILTEIYVPGYFIGRARTSDGLLGDPVNLGLHGSEGQVHLSMSDAGWIRADELDFRAGRRIVLSVLRTAQLPRGAGEPADTCSTGGRTSPTSRRSRESLAAPPRAVLALSRGMAAARRVPRRLAGGRDVRPQASGSRCSPSR